MLWFLFRLLDDRQYRLLGVEMMYKLDELKPQALSRLAAACAPTAAAAAEPVMTRDAASRSQAMHGGAATAHSSAAAAGAGHHQEQGQQAQGQAQEQRRGRARGDDAALWAQLCGAAAAQLPAFKPCTLLAFLSACGQV